MQTTFGSARPEKTLPAWALGYRDKEQSTSASMPQPRILLLDADPFQLVWQSLRLRGAGYRRVATLDTAIAALDALRVDPQVFDVIICDLNMPGIDGIEFLRCLEASPYAGQVILLSGECARVLHTARTLLVRARIVLLGIVEKVSACDELVNLLRRWNPAAANAPSRLLLTFEPGDIERAAHERQWVLHYQPKIDLRTGQLAGLEALVRWDHPEHGLVFPDRFIKLAEECGAIDLLTDWVLREAMGQLAIWRIDGLRTSIAVNVSMDSLRAPDFTIRLESIAHDAGVSPADVTLEITESRLMAPSPTPLENLVRLRLRRFSLSIDDFGTGHSSLAQLRDVPFTELKVDRGFVSGARFDRIVRPILETSHLLARGLGMQSVGEGVETEDDWRLLRETGCDLAQGYFLGRPMPSAGVGDWLDSWERRRESLMAA